MNFRTLDMMKDRMSAPPLIAAIMLLWFAVPLMADLFDPTCTPATCDVVEGVLTNLPFAAFAGDVILLDADGSISDVVRFFNNIFDTGGGTGLGNQVLMYSKVDSGTDLSVGPDLGLPATFSVNAVRIPEAPEGSPTLYSGNGTLYSFYSDAPVPEPVPEPRTLLLTLATVLVAVFVGRNSLQKRRWP
jgi:hypothetical protein